MTAQHQPGPDRGADPSTEHRGIATILSELADVERHLREVPPHHSGGGADLARRADALRRELAAARAAGTARPGQQQAQQQQ